jgi:Protein phosphatase 2C
LKHEYRKWLDHVYPAKKKSRTQELFSKHTEVPEEEKDQLCESSDWSDGYISDEKEISDDFETKELQTYQAYQEFKERSLVPDKIEKVAIKQESKPEKSSLRSKFDLSTSGASCTLVLKVSSTVIIGWVGTSRVASVGSKKWYTHAHLPSVPAEQLRVYQHQGEVRPGAKCGRPLVFVRGRLFPGCPYSRSLGDVVAH